MIRFNNLTGHVWILSFPRGDYRNQNVSCTWWRHLMETFSPLLAFSVWNSSVTGEFTTQRPATRCFDVFFDLRLNLQVSKQWRSRWFETPSRSLWRHCNVFLGLWTGARHNYWTENTNHFTYLVMTMEYISLALISNAICSASIVCLFWFVAIYLTMSLRVALGITYDCPSAWWHCWL